MYSSGNSHFLSALIAAATGVPTGIYADKHLFKPLGIRFEQRDTNDRVTTWEDSQLVPESWVEESTRDHVLRTGNFGFGYHWVVARRGGHLAFNADGWGGQIICVVPALDMVVVIKSDAESPGSHAYYDILAKVIEAASAT